jgi:hypothetical protein
MTLRSLVQFLLNVADLEIPRRRYARSADRASRIYRSRHGPVPEEKSGRF